MTEFLSECPGCRTDASVLCEHGMHMTRIGEPDETDTEHHEKSDSLKALALVWNNDHDPGYHLSQLVRLKDEWPGLYEAVETVVIEWIKGEL